MLESLKLESPALKFPKLEPSAMWRAVQARNKSFSEAFLFGVATTKVFCRPGCPSRLPLRENVRFYATAADALADGMRACLRCKPLQHNGNVGEMRQVCSFIRQNLEDRAALTLASLAGRVNLSPFHFQRKFKAAVGVTPRQYVESLRVQTFKEASKDSSVTQAIYSAGFGSSSSVYQRAADHLGMTPGQYRRGGPDVAISYATASTPLGLVMIGATDRGLCFLEFGADEQELLASLQQVFPAASLAPLRRPYPDEFAGWMRALNSYLEGERAQALTPIALHGTAFQLKVWKYLQTIPAGSVESYTEVARAVGHPTAVRAVASACAANRIAIAVPCHRVIRGDGGLGGYRWGLDRKRTLLANERKTAALTS